MADSRGKLRQNTFKGSVIILLPEKITCWVNEAKTCVVSATSQMACKSPACLSECRWADGRVESYRFRPKTPGRECHIDFVFDYICAFPLCRGEFYQEALRSADSGGTTRLVHLVLVHLLLCTVRRRAGPAFTLLLVFLQTMLLICRDFIISIVHFAQLGD